MGIDKYIPTEEEAISGGETLEKIEQSEALENKIEGEITREEMLKDLLVILKDNRPPSFQDSREEKIELIWKDRGIGGYSRKKSLEQRESAWAQFGEIEPESAILQIAKIIAEYGNPDEINYSVLENLNLPSKSSKRTETFSFEELEPAIINAVRSSFPEYSDMSVAEVGVEFKRGIMEWRQNEDNLITVQESLDKLNSGLSKDEPLWRLPTPKELEIAWNNGYIKRGDLEGGLMAQDEGGLYYVMRHRTSGAYSVNKVDLERHQYGYKDYFTREKKRKNLKT